MFGHHGPASAPGARTAVLSDSLRRTVLLLGLLVGVLTAGWVLGATDAEAEEISVGADTVTVDAPVTDTVDLVGDTLETKIEEPVDQSEVAESSQVTEGSQPSEAVEASNVVETFETTETGEATETAEAEEPRPLTDTVAQTGREATASVREISETDVPEIAVDGDDLVESVQWAVDEITRTVNDRLDLGEVPPRREVTPDPVSGEDPTPRQEAVEDRDDVPVTPENQRSETVVDLVEHTDPSVTGPNVATGDTPLLDPHGSTPTASASQGAATGLAGHLSAAGTPIPALAFEDATRHVLRAVPTAGADEPTFAPD